MTIHLYLVGGWTNPSENMLVRLNHFPKDRGEHKKISEIETTNQICMVWSPKNLFFFFATRRGIIRHNSFSNARRLPKGKFHWGSCTKIGIVVVVTVTVITILLLLGRNYIHKKSLTPWPFFSLEKKHNQNNTFGGVEKVLYINTYCI